MSVRYAQDIDARLVHEVVKEFRFIVLETVRRSAEV